MLKIEAVLVSTKDGKVDASAVVSLLRSASDEAYQAQSGAGAQAFGRQLTSAADALSAMLEPVPAETAPETAPEAQADPAPKASRRKSKAEAA